MVFKALPRQISNDSTKEFFLKKTLYICGGVTDISDVISARLEVNEPFPSGNENTPGDIVENWEYCRLVKDNFVYISTIYSIKKEKLRRMSSIIN